jgi:hypothetical protein
MENTLCMSVFARNLVSRLISGLMISGLTLALSPSPLLASGTASAILHSQGGVWVNGTEATDSIAVFPGDWLETKSGFVANLDAEGSSVLIQPESVVTFQGTFLNLEHGGVAVGTSTSMSVHVNCIRVEPVTKDRTQYEVGDVNGTVHVAARKDDVNIKQTGGLSKASSQSDASQSATVHEGQEATRNESQACGGARSPNGMGGPTSTKWLEIGGGVAGGGAVLCLLLCTGGSTSSNGSVSPSQP